MRRVRNDNGANGSTFFDASVTANDDLKYNSYIACAYWVHRVAFVVQHPIAHVASPPLCENHSVIKERLKRAVNECQRRSINYRGKTH